MLGLDGVDGVDGVEQQDDDVNRLKKTEGRTTRSTRSSAPSPPLGASHCCCLVPSWLSPPPIVPSSIYCLNTPCCCARRCAVASIRHRCWATTATAPPLPMVVGHPLSTRQSYARSQLVTGAMMRVQRVGFRWKAGTGRMPAAWGAAGAPMFAYGFQCQGMLRRRSMARWKRIGALPAAPSTARGGDPT